MQLSLITVLITAEFILLLLGVSITLGVMLLRKSKPTNIETDKKQDINPTTELDNFDLGDSYIDFIEQAMQRNTSKINQQQNIEKDIESEKDNESATETNKQTDDENDQPPTPPTEQQSELLQFREKFLQVEKSCAEHTEHDINFWESIYDGMKDILDEYKTTESISETTEKDPVQEKSDSKEKVFYIETQGKKIDGEVNKLKDIIYEQENALSSMKKAMENVPESDDPDESAALSEIRQQIMVIESQLNDSKMCMEVLEMENDRLQQEVDSMEAKHDALFEAPDEEESDSLIDLEQMKEVVEQQEAKINSLLEAIEALEIDTEQAESLKSTISDFARTSKEMMSCITILEEENERLQKDTADEASATTDLSLDTPSTANSTANSTGDSTGDSSELTGKISQLEEDLIKKDVAYAQLQDEFNSMESEYLSMYESMHGDK